MALSDEVTTRLGEPLLVQLTRFDAPLNQTVDTDRLNAAIVDGTSLIRREVGLVEPDESNTDEWRTFVALLVKAVRYQLLWYRSPEGQETKNALQEFRDQAQTWRQRTDINIVTDSVVDTSDEDTEDRRARFAPSHFDDFRIR